MGISGNAKPKVGTTYAYEVLDITTPFVFDTKNIIYIWQLFKKKNGAWDNITEGQGKIGTKVNYTFFEAVEGIPFRLVVYKGTKLDWQSKYTMKKFGSLELVPSSALEPQIKKVTLFNPNSSNVNKASYKDVLIARAHCVGMFNEEVSFQLWEDDAEGAGHNAQINKNNSTRKVFKALVDHRGIAETKIALMSDEKVLRSIADRFLMMGDTSEGANHEYYVTASYLGKIKGASQVNVNVSNPGYKAQPNPNTSKFPASGSNNITKQSDPRGKIIDAYFINDKFQKLSQVSVGDSVKVRIHTNNMENKHVQFVIWEYDNLNSDEIFRSGKIKIAGEYCDTNSFTISKKMFDKGIDFSIGDPDNKVQNYYIEVIALDISEDSEKFSITLDVYKDKAEKQKSPVMVKEPAKRKEKEEESVSKCYCYSQGIVETACNGKGNLVINKHFENLANDLGVDAKVFKAVAIVESGGKNSFINVDGSKKAKILYERHYMYRFLKKIKTEEELSKLKRSSPDIVHNVATYKDPNAKYGSEKEQFVKLKNAKKIDNDSAIKSCSWGKFQVMGKYYNYLYSCPNELEEAMNICEVQHFAYFKTFLKKVTGAPMIKAMKEKNWNKIAELYNGEEYAKNKYHIKMRNEYNKL